jgi:hypothetical protein
VANPRRRDSEEDAMKLVYEKLSELLTEVKARGKVDGVRVGAMMSSTIEAGLPTYTGWIIVSVHGDCFDTWAEWRLATGRQRAEVTEKGVRVPDKLTAFTEEKLAEVRGWIETAGLAMRDGILAADTEILEGVLA